MLQKSDLKENDWVVFMHDNNECMGIVGVFDGEVFIVTDNGDDFDPDEVKLIRKAGEFDKMSHAAHSRLAASPQPKHADAWEIRNQKPISLKEKRAPFSIRASSGKSILL